MQPKTRERYDARYDADISINRRDNSRIVRHADGYAPTPIALSTSSYYFCEFAFPTAFLIIRDRFRKQVSRDCRHEDRVRFKKPRRGQIARCIAQPRDIKAPACK